MVGPAFQTAPSRPSAVTTAAKESTPTPRPAPTTSIPPPGHSGRGTPSGAHNGRTQPQPSPPRAAVRDALHRPALRQREQRLPDARARHAEGFGERPSVDLDVGGIYAWRRDGEAHLWSPTSVAKLQKAVRLEDATSYADYAEAINDQSAAPVTLRSLWDFDTKGLPAVPLDEVEPASRIVRRFATGAMSFGSISKEAHETMAIAMNRIGGNSNNGEGGEDPARFVPDVRGDLKKSAIKQIASGRFGVTLEYLASAEEIQILSLIHI